MSYKRSYILVPQKESAAIKDFVYRFLNMTGLVYETK